MSDKTSTHRKALQAIILTVFTGGSFHLMLVGISAFKGHHENANPVAFLGIGLLFPQLAHSRAWFIGLWIALFACGFGYFYFLLRAQATFTLLTNSSHYKRLQQTISRGNDPHTLLVIALLRHAADTAEFETTGGYTQSKPVAIYE